MDVSFENIAYGAAGVAMMALFIWSWRGRNRAARWWVKRNDLAPNIAMGIVPGVGALLVGVELWYIFGESMLAISAPLTLLGLPIAFIGFCFPRLWAPKWFKQIHRDWKDKSRS